MSISSLLQRRSFRTSARMFLALALLVTTDAGLHAQALPSTSRLFGVSSFASFGIVNTNSTQLGNAFAHEAVDGYVIGTDLEHPFHGLIPALEIRTTFTNGNIVRERMIGGGMSVAKNLRWISPYADLLVGSGVVTYPGNKTLPFDTSVVMQYGGGVNVQVRGPWALRLDLQEQSWRTGVEVPRFYPTSLTGGFAYRPRPRGYITR